MSQHLPDPHERAWVDVDLRALRRNAAHVADRVAPARLLPMIKADGYGLGAVEVARTLEPLQPYAFGVATPTEGAQLREAGITRRIIVFSPLAAFETGRMVEAGLDAAVLSLDSLRRIASTAAAVQAEVEVHLEIDTGMGRAGLPAASHDRWVPAVTEILTGGRVRLASVFTHFHSADVDPAETGRQLERFELAVCSLEVGVAVPLRHAANSDAVILDRQYHLDLVRPGIYLYGGRRGAGIEGLLPDPEAVACVRARVLEVRELEAGSPLNYGGTYVTPAPERIATLGVGYADGIPWGLSNTGTAIVRGTRVPIRGSVCMDMTSVDVSGVPGVEPGTVATLLGADGAEEITLGEVAEVGQTIEWQVLTGLGKRLPRRHIEPEDA